MRLDHKRSPAFEDTDIMQFGKHKGEPLSDVPPHYLRWLWQTELSTYSRNEKEFKPDWIMQKIKLANYIWNSQDAIAGELGETFV